MLGTDTQALTTPYCLPAADVLARLGVAADTGLTAPEVERRVRRYGANVVPVQGGAGVLRTLAAQFRNPLIYVLLAAGAITLAFGDLVEAGVIAGVVVLNAVIGFVQESRARQALEALARMVPAETVVVRDGVTSRVPANVLGYVTTTELFPATAHAGLVGRVTATDRAQPSDVALAAHGAMSRRRSHRGPFRRLRVGSELTARILAANQTDGVELRVVSEVDVDALANVLGHSAQVLRNDHAYQRELNAWTSSVRDPLPGDGVSASTRRTATLPWAGLVRATTAVPDPPTLAERLRAELLVLVETPDDGPLDHMRAWPSNRRGSPPSPKGWPGQCSPSPSRSVSPAPV